MYTLPGLPGGPPLAPRAKTPSRILMPAAAKSQLILPEWVEERRERERRRRDNPIVQFIYAQYFLKWGLPSMPTKDLW